MGWCAIVDAVAGGGVFVVLLAVLATVSLPAFWRYRAPGADREYAASR